MLDSAHRFKYFGPMNLRDANKHLHHSPATGSGFFVPNGRGVPQRFTALLGHFFDSGATYLNVQSL